MPAGLDCTNGCTAKIDGQNDLGVRSWPPNATFERSELSDGAKGQRTLGGPAHNGHLADAPALAWPAAYAWKTGPCDEAG
jgi:hypothetical protein